jgi:N,N'-diacetyllegionaminate synthase
MQFIAEIGMNHNGHFSLCYELIKQAKYAGADIAKFQLGWRDKPGEINQITEEIIAQLLKWGDYFGIEIMFSIINRDAFTMIKKFDVKRYKVASRTVKEDSELVQWILDEKKPTLISLGMWGGTGLPFAKTPEISYLWCKSKYPTEPWDLTDLPKDFGGSPYAGYSDHTVGIEVPLMAIVRGATVIEKHFTLDKSNTTIRDHALSATPDEFRLLVDLGRDIHKKLQIGV